jgi:hypothetical protein
MYTNSVSLYYVPVRQKKLGEYLYFEFQLAATFSGLGGELKGRREAQNLNPLPAERGWPKAG